MKHGTYTFDRTDKRSGVTYVYSCTSFWNKEKKRPENKQVLLGIRDPETGDVHPTRSSRKAAESTSGSAAPEYRQLYCGATHLLDEIGRITDEWPGWLQNADPVVVPARAGMLEQAAFERVREMLDQYAPDVPHLIVLTHWNRYTTNREFLNWL